MVLAFDDLLRAPERPADARVCPDCRSHLRDESTESGTGDHLHRCTRCGAGWETNSAGWMFPSHAA